MNEENKIVLTGTVQAIVKVYNKIVPPNITGFHINVEDKNPFSIFVIYEGNCEYIRENAKVKIAGRLVKYDNFCIVADSVEIKEE